MALKLFHGSAMEVPWDPQDTASCTCCSTPQLFTCHYFFHVTAIHSSRWHMKSHPWAVLLQCHESCGTCWTPMKAHELPWQRDDTIYNMILHDWHWHRMTIIWAFMALPWVCHGLASGLPWTLMLSRCLPWYCHGLSWHCNGLAMAHGEYHESAIGQCHEGPRKPMAKPWPHH